jgi:hypothetical protein
MPKVDVNEVLDGEAFLKAIKVYLGDNSNALLDRECFRERNVFSLGELDGLAVEDLRSIFNFLVAEGSIMEEVFEEAYA